MLTGDDMKEWKNLLKSCSKCEVWSRVVGRCEMRLGSPDCNQYRNKDNLSREIAEALKDVHKIAFTIPAGIHNQVASPWGESISPREDIEAMSKRILRENRR